MSKKENVKTTCSAGHSAMTHGHIRCGGKRRDHVIADPVVAERSFRRVSCTSIHSGPDAIFRLYLELGGARALEQLKCGVNGDLDRNTYIIVLDSRTRPRPKQSCIRRFIASHCPAPVHCTSPREMRGNAPAHCVLVAIESGLAWQPWAAI